jgi:hypothetical protein
VIAEQIPAKLLPDVIKNTAVKVVHRLPARDDRDSVGATINLTEEQSRFLVTLAPGTGAVFADGMDRPVLVAVPDGTAVERTGPDRPTASPARLAAERSGACPPACATDPCSLRRMTGARRLLADDPRLVLWAELAVLGHLVGLPAPTLSAASRAVLSRTEPRLLDCALGHAVAAATASRSAALVSSHSPERFACHVATELRAQLAGGCVDEVRTWLAPCFRWNPVRLALQDRQAADPGAARHPDSERWAAGYGRQIPGDTCWEQLDTVRQWCVDLLRDGAQVNAVVYGTGTPSAIERAVGATRDDGDGWRPALARALDALVVHRGWPLAFLAPAPLAGRGTDA